MKRYNRLTDSDKRKLDFYTKISKFFKKVFKYNFILLILIISISFFSVLFFQTMDTHKNKNKNLDKEYIQTNISKTNLTNDDQKLDTFSKDELDKDFENGRIKNEDLEDSQAENQNIVDEKTNIITNSKKKLDFSEWNKTCDKNLIVINNNNPLSEGFKVKTKLCRGKEVNIDVCEKLEQMISDASKEGVVLWISSGYRSVELQTKLFNQQVDREKDRGTLDIQEAERKAQTVVARPGMSEHNSGLAVDFNGVQNDFYKTDAYKWLMDNAHKYGFIERYRQNWQNITGVIYEPWHFRYVGIEYAEDIKNSGLSLEEYVYKKLINKPSSNKQTGNEVR